MCVPDNGSAAKPEAVGPLYSRLKVEAVPTTIPTQGKGFDPESRDYDYTRAKAAGLGPDGTGENKGHWGSVAPTNDQERKKYGLAEDSYVILKGKTHETFDKAVSGEEARGFKVVKKGDRYYSVPGDKK